MQEQILTQFSQESSLASRTGGSGPSSPRSDATHTSHPRGMVATSGLNETAGATTSSIKNDYILKRCEMPQPSELQPIETFVMNALQSQLEDAPDPAHVQGYRAIIDTLRRPMDPVMIRLVLIALRTAGNGSVLNNLTSHATKHAQLTHFIFRFDGSSPPPGLQQQVGEDAGDDILAVYQDGSILDAHLHLILAMVSARTVNLIPALTTVWKMLSENIHLNELFTNRLHSMLCTMMRLVPKARTDFFPILASRFPFWKKDAGSILWYCSQSFEVLNYLPSFRKQLLELVIDKCLEIDVHIKIKDNGEVAVEKGDENTEKTNVESEGVNELSDKLDSLLALLFTQLQQGALDSERTRELYYEVLPVFESTILTTYKSKFVQYCVFFLCGLESKMATESPSKDESELDYEHSILHRDFAAKLLEIIVDPYRATLTRQSGACYLASFVSRASYVGPETVCESVSALLRWAEAYIDTLGSGAIRAADAREQSQLHSLFYTVCQAAFYIMCFRGSEAIEFFKDAVAGYSTHNETNSGSEELPDPDHINLGAKRWTNLCSHELQPLRFCLESVRSEFLHVAHFFDLIEESKLDRLVLDAKRLSTGRVNKKAASTIKTSATLEKQRLTGGVGGLGRGSNPLRSFFPFDPLLLRRSHGIVEHFYMHWDGPVEEEDILVIDDGPDNDDLVFNMEEDGEEDSDAEEDVPGVVISDQETKAEDSDAESDTEASVHSPNVYQKKELQKKAWTETFKRPRSQSMENGSW